MMQLIPIYNSTNTVFDVSNTYKTNDSYNLIGTEAKLGPNYTPFVVNYSKKRKRKQKSKKRKSRKQRRQFGGVGRYLTPGGIYLAY